MTNFTNKMEVDQDIENDPENKQAESFREDRVLIEKDGKFELVSVSDMQAKGVGVDLDPQEMQQRPETSKDAREIIQQKQSLGSSTVNDSCVNIHTQEDGAKPSSLESETRQSQTNNIEKEDGTKIASNIKSESRVSIIVKESSLLDVAKPTSNKLNASSTSALTRNSKQKLLFSRFRTQSAPGCRVKTQSSENDLQRRERNEAAFRAWLAKKDRELALQRQYENSKAKKSGEELREKQKRNEAAYQAWLECKKQEYLQQRTKEKVIRPVTSISKDEEDKRRAAFESWLTRKQEEKQKEIDHKLRAREQEEVTAKKADPTLVGQAYKSWLHRKRAQAKDEALRKEQYRRKYFRQSRRLKQSATLRFEGF